MLGIYRQRHRFRVANETVKGAIYDCQTMRKLVDINPRFKTSGPALYIYMHYLTN